MININKIYFSKLFGLIKLIKKLINLKKKYQFLIVKFFEL